MSEKEWLDRFSNKLVELLNNTGMTQRELAREAGLAESSVSDYIHGLQMPGTRAILNMSIVLNVKPKELIDFGSMIVD